MQSATLIRWTSIFPGLWPKRGFEAHKSPSVCNFLFLLKNCNQTHSLNQCSATSFKSFR